MTDRVTPYIAGLDKLLAELAAPEILNIGLANHDNAKRPMERERRIIAVELAPFGLLRNDEHRRYHGRSHIGAFFHGIFMLINPFKRRALKEDDAQLAEALKRIDKNADTMLNNYAIDAANGQSVPCIPDNLTKKFKERVAAHIFLDTPPRPKPKKAKKEKTRHA